MTFWAWFSNIFYPGCHLFMFQAEISSQDYVIKRCYLPCETTVISIYISGLFLLIICLLLPTKIPRKLPGDKEMVFVNKSHWYCKVGNFREKIIFPNSVKRHICDVKNSRLGHDLAISINNRVISAFGEDFIFSNLYAKFRENKVLAKIFEFTVLIGSSKLKLLAITGLITRKPVFDFSDRVGHKLIWD